MKREALQAYALRGLNARLAELDRERVRILELLAAWETPRPARPTASSGSPRKQSSTLEAESREHIAAPEELLQAPSEPDVEVARILPRRRQLPERQPAAPVTSSLPPMPRLVKAKAS